MSQTKSVSIPERAREIAHQMADSVAIPLWAHESCVKNFVIVIESALHSERELCAKELEAVITDAESKKVFLWAAKLLRDGGQK